MTFCTAWVLEDKIYMLADTLLSTKKEYMKGVTSTGQRHRKIEHLWVAEAVFKIIPIDNQCVVTFAGDVALGVSVARFLKENLNIIGDIQKLFSTISASLSPFNATVEMIIASYNKSPQLFHWCSDVPDELQSINGGIVIGSADKDVKGLVGFLINTLIELRVPEDYMLPTMAALLAEYGVLNDSLKQYFGGVFFGCKIARDGLKWQSDTLSIIYDPSFRNIGMFACLARDGVLVTKSNYSNTISLLPGQLIDISQDDWLKKWATEIDGQLFERQAEFFCWLSNKNFSVTVIKVPSMVPTGKFFKFEHATDPSLLEDGRDTLIAAQGDFLNKLSLEASPEQHGDVPIIISWDIDN